MILNAYFDNVLVFDVQNALHVVQSTKFGLEMEMPDPGTEVFANNDKVLQIDHHDIWIDVDALELGMSTIRIMNGGTILKDLVVTVRDAITRPATTLGGSLGEPQPK